MINNNCGMCKFYTDKTEEDGVNESSETGGECRRYPPTGRDEVQAAYFPQVYSNMDWCGEFKESLKRISELTLIENLEFTVRSYNGLMSAEIHTISDLIKWRKSDLLKIRCFGKKSLNEITDILQLKGFSLRSELEEKHPDVTYVSWDGETIL